MFSKALVKHILSLENCNTTCKNQNKDYKKTKRNGHNYIFHKQTSKPRRESRRIVKVLKSLRFLVAIITVLLWQIRKLSKLANIFALMQLPIHY